MCSCAPNPCACKACVDISLFPSLVRVGEGNFVPDCKFCCQSVTLCTCCAPIAL